MKILLLQLCLLFPITGFTKEETKLTKSIEESRKVLIKVPGMVCQMCVQGMKKNFKEVVNDPDKDVLVDLDKKTVLVIFKQKIKEDEIKKRVNDAGYNAKKITWID